MEQSRATANWGVVHMCVATTITADVPTKRVFGVRGDAGREWGLRSMLINHLQCNVPYA